MILCVSEPQCASLYFCYICGLTVSVVYRYNNTTMHRCCYDCNVGVNVIKITCEEQPNRIIYISNKLEGFVLMDTGGNYASSKSTWSTFLTDELVTATMAINTCDTNPGCHGHWVSVCQRSGWVTVNTRHWPIFINSDWLGRYGSRVINFFSAGTVFIRQNLTYVDVKFGRIETVPAVKKK